MILTILISTININRGREGEERRCLYDHFNEHEYFHFDNDQLIHMSSRIHEESGHDLNLDLLTVLY